MDGRALLREDATPRPERWGELMSAAQAGDRACYARLLQEIRPRIRSIASRSFRDRRDVDDVVQDVLLTLHAIRETYDRSRPFAPWLHGIVKHRIADRVRVRGRIWAREDSLTPAHEDIAAIETDVTTRLDWSGRALKAAIAALPFGQREAVRLLKLEEMSLKDAAIATGMSTSALKVACHRALKALRARLDPEVGMR